MLSGMIRQDSWRVDQMLICFRRMAAPRLPLKQMPLLVLPRFLAGMRFRHWLGLLHYHRWRIHPAFIPRALAATAGALLTSLLSRVEWLLERTPVDAAAWERPIFILGLGRSGTTHLFNLMAPDERVCVPTRFDVFHANTFLTRRRLGLAALYRLVPSRSRGMDGVQVNWFTPEEDVIALALLHGKGGRLDWCFPRSDSRRLDPEATIASLHRFTRKLVQLHGRPVVLKSPSHLSIVPTLLRAFPRARFLTIFREPARIVASVDGLQHSSTAFWATLQWPDLKPVEDIVERCGRGLAAYEAARPLIPEGQLAEIRYEDLVRDEVGTLRHAYQALGESPPSWLDTVVPHGTPYQANRHPPLPPEAQARLREAFAPLYERGFYGPGGEGEA